MRQARYVLAVLAVCTGAACGGSQKIPTVGPDVWAVVDGRDITREQVEKAYRQVVQPTLVPPSDDESMAAKLSLVDELITQDVLMAKAKALNLTVTPSELDTAFGARKANLTEDQFQKELASRRLTSDDMKEALRRELIVDKLTDREIKSKINVTDREIEEFYNANRDQFNVKEPQYHVAQIVITPVKDAQINNRKNDDATTPEQAAKKAQTLMDQLKGGAEFATLAMDYSEEPQSTSRAGDLGFISASALNQVPPELKAAVLRSQPGTVSHVAVGGAHTLVLLVGKEEAGQRPLSAPGVRDGIVNSLKDRKEQLLRAAFITKARNEVRIVNYLARQLVDSQGKPPSPIGPAK